MSQHSRKFDKRFLGSLFFANFSFDSARTRSGTKEKLFLRQKKIALISTRQPGGDGARFIKIVTKEEEKKENEGEPTK